MHEERQWGVPVIGGDLEQALRRLKRKMNHEWPQIREHRYFVGKKQWRRSKRRKAQLRRLRAEAALVQAQDLQRIVRLRQGRCKA